MLEEEGGKEKGGIRFSASQDYFGEYMKQVGQEISNLNTKQKKSLRKNSSSSNKRSSGSRSVRYSAADMKGINQVIQEAQTK